jgi:peptide subunit release factor 1 (eRF1)
VEPLLELLQTDDAPCFGLVLVSGETAQCYHWKIKLPGATVLTRAKIASLRSFVRNKQGRGGFSANRFARLRDNEVDHYIKEIIVPQET